MILVLTNKKIRHIQALRGIVHHGVDFVATPNFAGRLGEPLQLEHEHGGKAPNFELFRRFSGHFTRRALPAHVNKKINVNAAPIQHSTIIIRVTSHPSNAGHFLKFL